MSTLVKICGLSSEDALDAALEAGADALGFVLSPSPRQISLARAQELLARVPPGVEKIAVFARVTRAELAAALELEFDGIQAECDAPELFPLPAPRFFLPVLRAGPGLERGLRQLPASAAASGRRSLQGCVLLDGPLGGGRGILVEIGRAHV